MAEAVAFAAAILGLMRAADWLQPEDFPSAQSWGVAGAAIGVVYGLVSSPELIKLLGSMRAGGAVEGTTSTSDT